MILKKALKLLSESEKDIEQTHLHLIAELFQKQVGREIHLPYELVAKRTYDGVKVQRNRTEIQEVYEKTIHLLPDEQEEFCAKGKKIYCRVKEKEQETYKCEQKAGKQYFDYDIMQNGLTIRTRRPGDYITIHPDGRTQKLKAFFINEKKATNMRPMLITAFFLLLF